MSPPVARLRLFVGAILTLITAHVVGGPIVGPTEAQAGVECQTCHVDVETDSPVHGAFPCAACHSKIESYPHPENAIGAQRGASMCATCHGEVMGVSSVHAALPCLDCHTPAHSISSPSESVCSGCHAAAKDLAVSVHAEKALCHDCHGATHEIVDRADRASAVSPIRQFETCGGCHVGAGDPVGRYLSSSHGRALLVKGLISAPACSSCHGSHAVLPSSDPGSLLFRARTPETCGECHRFVLDTWASDSAHGALWQAGADHGPVCTTCHPAHQAERISDGSVRLKSPENCGGCHEEEYLTYRDSFHGKATDLGFLTGAICSDCHTPHQNLRADDPRSTIHPERLLATCERCHEGVTASFVSFDPHSDPTDPEGNPFVHYTWVFMTGLLVGVFGLFGVHDLLWFQRSVVGHLRGEFGSRPIMTGPHIRRFSNINVRVHLVVVFTFLLLAATGLPLKYHSTAWASAATAAFGGVGAMRSLHRLAAILTFGYAMFHVSHLLYRMTVRGERGLLWGANSLVPRSRDLVTFWQNLRYFLYAGPRPRLDRWTYWEKFDYFAVFWGIIIIGSSGLLLWFPSFFTRWLPGWALNVAMVVHSDEALLAVGFIFLFHFFHTHLRPESFPLDPVIFTGLMPLSRFQEERPLEYQRLVESGELAGALVDSPSVADIRRARVIGFAAVGIGLLLVIAIFWSMWLP